MSFIVSLIDAIRFTLNSEVNTGVLFVDRINSNVLPGYPITEAVVADFDAVTINPYP